MQSLNTKPLPRKGDQIFKNYSDLFVKRICQNVEFVEKENIGDLILFKRLLQWAYQELRKI